MISSISSFEIINVVVPNANIFYCIPLSAAATINPNAIKTLLVNVLGTFFIKGKKVFILVMVQDVYVEILLTIRS